MKEETLKLIELIQKGKTLNEIGQILGMSHKMIFTRLSLLKNSGYFFDRNYYYNGEIKYKIRSPLQNSKNNEIMNVIKEDHTGYIRAILISDIHLGHIQDELKCLDSMNEYCIKQNIHLILNAGDFFEGIYKDRIENNKCKSAREQINYALKKYPYDKNILSFVVLGNHDLSFWKEYGIDIKEILLDRRHDIVPIGYEHGQLNINGINITINHSKKSLAIPKGISLRGHSHKFKIIQGPNYIFINVPTLSSVPTIANLNPIPSMIDMKLEVQNGRVYREYLKHLIFINNKPNCIGEFEFFTPITYKNDVKVKTKK